MSLANGSVDSVVRILNIRGGSDVRLQLTRLGIRAGDLLMIKRNAPLGGPLVVSVSGADVAVGRQIAEQILIEDA
jgi:Fe2+ transport system protein FeoA